MKIHLGAFSAISPRVVHVESFIISWKSGTNAVYARKIKGKRRSAVRGRVKKEEKEKKRRADERVEETAGGRTGRVRTGAERCIYSVRPVGVGFSGSTAVNWE